MSTPPTPLAGPARKRSLRLAEARQTIDSETKELCAELAGRGKLTTVAIRCGQPIGSVTLLPFQLHLRWPDALSWLPLGASFAIAPFRGSAADDSALPLYEVSRALNRRRKARLSRHEAGATLHGDLQVTDWELGALRNLDTLAHRVLGGRSFLTVVRVGEDGVVRRLSRPVLGRHARHAAPRPEVFVPGRGCDRAGAAVLAAADLLVVDIQRLRGRRSIQVVREVLRSRSADQTTLIVAGSPSDIFAVDTGDLFTRASHAVVGTPAELEAVAIRVVGTGRATADRRFDAAVTPLRGLSPAANRLCNLADYAWWSCNQALTVDEVRSSCATFETVLEQFRQSDPHTADLFTGCAQVISGLAEDEGAPRARLQAVVSGVVVHGGGGKILVLARSRDSVAAVRRELTSSLELSNHELQALGVEVAVYGSRRDFGPVDLVVMAGYAGLVSLDSAMAARPHSVLAVFDPIEARAAWYGACRMRDYLAGVGCHDAAVPLGAFAAGVLSGVPGFSDEVEFALPTPPVDPPATRLTSTDLAPTTVDSAVVMFTDGSHFLASRNARFEVLGKSALRSRVQRADELEPGDEVVLLHESSRELFSERRIAVLDAGPLRQQSQVREEWLTLVRAVATGRALTPGTIARRMTLAGYSVSAAAVASWLCADSDAAHAPRSFEGFVQFARALDFDLDEAKLRHYHTNIHQWRVRHRTAGLELTRAIQLARSARLGHVTQARIEQNWGIEVRELLESARVAVVDEVLLQETIE